MKFFGLVLALCISGQHVYGLVETTTPSRRETLRSILAGGVSLIVGTPSAWGAAAVQDSLDVDQFLRSGMDLGGNMGVSSQAGKSRPETGVFLRGTS